MTERATSAGLISVVVPAREEDASVAGVIGRILTAVRSQCEILVVVDSADDSTRAVAAAIAAADPRVRCLVGAYQPGPAGAIRYGVDHARGDIIVVTMADGSDDPRQIQALADLIAAGAAVAAASRYAPGGRMLGGPPVKRLLSWLAGRSLHLFASAGTTDATNSFKAYAADFVREVGIDSTAGFTVGIELVAKARRLRRPVAEIPTIWRDRETGNSGFRLLAWLPRYVRWYLFCFGRPLSSGEIRARCGGRLRSAPRRPGAHTAGDPR